MQFVFVSSELFHTPFRTPSWTFNEFLEAESLLVATLWLLISSQLGLRCSVSSFSSSRAMSSSFNYCFLSFYCVELSCSQPWIRLHLIDSPFTLATLKCLLSDLHTSLDTAFVLWYCYQCFCSKSMLLRATTPTFRSLNTHFDHVFFTPEKPCMWNEIIFAQESFVTWLYI